MIRRFRELANGLTRLASSWRCLCAPACHARWFTPPSAPRLRPGIFGAHALWHLLVIGGSACHVWAVARYRTPLA